MGEVRVLSNGVTNDYDGFSTFMAREAAYIEEREPGTMAMEIFAEKATGRVVVHELYADEDAFITHVEDLMTGDRVGELARLFELKRLTFLTPIEDERVAAIARQFNAIEASPVAGFTR